MSFNVDKHPTRKKKKKRLRQPRLRNGSVYKKTMALAFYLYEVSNIVKFIKSKTGRVVTRG